MTLLKSIQNQIEKIYKINTGIVVDNFIITKETCDAILNGSKVMSRGGKGYLFLWEKKEELNLGVYLDEEIVSKFKFLNRLTISDENFNDFFTLIEEISHFVYAAWNVMNDKQISKFEMELQGEVDKYIIPLLYYGDRKISIDSGNIKDRLFSNFLFDSRLSKEEIVRYVDANKMAYKYCSFLDKRFVKNDYICRLLEEIRMFYRLKGNGKLDHIRKSGVNFY